MFHSKLNLNMFTILNKVTLMKIKHKEVKYKFKSQTEKKDKFIYGIYINSQTVIILLKNS